MKAVWKRILTVLALAVFVYVLAMPVAMGGFGYGASGATRRMWQVSVHYTHHNTIPTMGQGLGWMGNNALVSGLIQLGLLILIIAGSIWLVGAVARRPEDVN